MRPKNKPEDVFKHINMQNGDTEKCWPWKGKVNEKDGRPYFTINGKRSPSYSVVLHLVYRDEYTRGLVARHKCDNKICCNPKHLEWGTHQDNMNDMKARDRHGLPKTVIRAIRKLIDDNRPQRAIADLYGVSRETISAIATGRTHGKDDHNIEDKEEKTNSHKRN